MDRRRVIVSAAVVATVGAATALTLPAIAGTDPDTDAPSSAPRVSAQMSAALQRDLNLNADQVTARLAKEAWAIQTRKSLAQTLGGTYGGAWLDADASQLTVAVTNQQAAAAVEAAGAEPKLVTRSARQLAAIKQSLARTAARGTSSITALYVDPATNSVVVTSTSRNMSAVRSLVASSGVAADAVRVVTTGQRPRLLGPQQPPEPDPSDSSAPEEPSGLAVRGGDAYLIDNVARCSVGFSVEGGFVSAGHCGQEGSTTTDGQEDVAQGAFEGSTFGAEGDFSFVATNEDVTPVAEVNSFEGDNLPVAGSEEAPIGTSVCKFGSTTGASCGVVQALDVTVDFADPEGGPGTVTVNGLIQTDVCAEPGDSGGSLLAGDQAQGMVSGGSGNCTVGGQTFFQPVNEALQTFDLTLLTSA